MKRLNRLVAAVAFVPVVAISSSALAGSVGQLGGGDTYQVKNVTQNTAYSNNVTAACGDIVEYSMELGNTGFGTLTNVTLKATLPEAGGTSTATATTDQGGTTGTSDTASVSLASGTTQSLENGTTILYGDHGNVITTLPDTITSGVNIGTLNGSTTEFVNFKAKVSCPTPPPPVYTCDLLSITTGDNRTVKISAFNTTAKNGASFKNGDINWGDNSSSNGLNPVVGKTHQYSKDGTYTIVGTAHFDVNGSDKTATSAACEQQVTFKGGTTTVTPPTQPSTPGAPAPTELVNTGAGNVAGLFAAVTAASAVAYRLVISRRLSRQ
jgi:uncharacterized repeat protein (TIGR01451 family)